MNNLSETAIKNKREYDKKYIKEHYRTMNISMPKEEIENIKETIKSKGFKINEFIRLCVKLLKEDKIKRD